MLSRLRESLRTKGLLCTIGLHSPEYKDAAYFVSAKRCDRCGHSSTPGSLHLLETERALWKEVPKSQPFSEQVQWVLDRLPSAF